MCQFFVHKPLTKSTSLKIFLSFSTNNKMGNLFTSKLAPLTFYSDDTLLPWIHVAIQFMVGKDILNPIRPLPPEHRDALL
uniref:Uncharacterized protein n=1 Tax=Pararge aegeria TaxID=116150 RepID=S4PG24_9NEOP